MGVAEFIEVTKAWDGEPQSINVDDISSFVPSAKGVTLPGPTKATVFLRSIGQANSGIGVTESYDSIKETLRIRGIYVHSIIPIDGPQQVMVPRAWLEAIQPIVQAFCDSRESKPGDPAGIVCDTCPLGLGDTCLKNELPRLIGGEHRG